MESFHLDPSGVRDISSQLTDAQGRLRVVPAAVLADTTPEERMLFGVRHGFYGLPTVELCDFLRARIRGRSAIEIGAGSGVLGRTLGIPATDSFQQDDPAVRAYYDMLGQPTVPYGHDVQRLDAAQALQRYRPSVVIGCWVTHRFDRHRAEAGGNAWGVDEEAVIAECDEYIFIGNRHVHRHKPILALPHEEVVPSWLYSRAVNGTRDFIGIWIRSSSPSHGHLAE